MVLTHYLIFLDMKEKKGFFSGQYISVYEASTGMSSKYLCQKGSKCSQKTIQFLSEFFRKILDFERF